MDQQFEHRLRNALRLPDHLCDQIIAELSDHDQLNMIEGNSSFCESPEQLAEAFHEAHIPLYRFMQSQYCLTLFVMGIFLLFRSGSLFGTALLYSLDQPFVWRVELVAIVLHVYLIYHLRKKALHHDQLFTGWKLSGAILFVQSAALLFFAFAHISLSIPIVFIECLRAVLYFFLVPLALSEVKGIIQNRWIQFIHHQIH